MLHNLDDGLVSALVATFRAKGLSAQQALAKAQQRLGEARTRFSASTDFQDPHGIKLAMRDVITWARALQ
jgi:hypothetical protein